MPVKKAPIAVPVPRPNSAPTSAPKAVPAAVPATATKPGSVPVKAAAKPLPQTPVVALPVAATATADEVHEEEDNSLQVILDKFSDIQTQIKEFNALLKLHQKSFARLQKQSKKAERKRAGARKTQSGFAKPSKLSEELCVFLGIDKGSELARTQVTKLITNYIKTHNLNDAANKRKIIPDVPLQRLLNYKVGTDPELTYFNLQRFMKHQFIKAVPAPVAVDVA